MIFEILCDCKILLKLKGKSYRTATRQSICYDSEYWDGWSENAKDEFNTLRDRIRN